MVAFSAGAAPAPVAADPPLDQTSDGTAAPEPDPGFDPALSPDFDPGGDSTDLPFDAPPVAEVPAPPDPGGDDAAPLEPEPETDVEVPVADPGDGADPPVPEQPAQPPEPTPVATPTPEATPTPTPQPTPTPSGTAPVAPEDEPAVTETDAPDGDSGADAQPRERRPQPSAEARAPHTWSPEQASRSTIAEPAAPPAAGDEPARVTPVRVEVSAGDGRARPGERSHVVLAGESLWSIAADLLGRDASPARVAREVNRLWTLNAARIATGDRDLILVGTVLRLR